MTRPIIDPTQGQYQVVISYCRPAWPGGPDAYRKFLELDMANQDRPIADLDIAVRVIGAAGERSEVEGEWPPNAREVAQDGRSGPSAGSTSPELSEGPSVPEWYAARRKAPL